MSDEADGKSEKSEQEWRKELSEEAFHILRERGTEPAGSGEWLHNKEEGLYLCKGCGQELFASGQKFQSGTGWPSFWKPLSEGVIDEVPDHRHGRERTEVVCSSCGGHLGHVFEDGPDPTGLRYCINSLALDFEADEEGGNVSE